MRRDNKRTTWADMPRHLQFNPYVRRHYRPLTDAAGCCASVLSLHNETGNIITHAIPAFLILCSLPWLLPWSSLSVGVLPWVHAAAFSAPWVGSTLYHVFMCHEGGPGVYSALIGIDVVGVWMGECLGGLIPIMASLHCLDEPVVGLILAAYAVAIIHSAYKAVCARTPLERGLSFLPPFLFRLLAVILRGLGAGGHALATKHFVAQDAIALAGITVGIAKVPERWLPGRFDLAFNSHQIMHVLFVWAAIHMHVASSLDMQWMSDQHACTLQRA